MIELLDRAEKYASGKTSAMIDKAIALAYADGYRDGYTDREKEIPIDLRNGKTEFVDLGLKSQTLWSKDFEKEGCRLQFLPYSCINTLNIPTVKQWEELFNDCRWVYTTINKLATDKIFKEVLCIGPNGNSIKFNVTGFYLDKELQENGFIYCWLRGENELNSLEKSCGFIGRRCVKRETIGNLLHGYYETNHSVIKQFSGYRLPIRLVMEKN